MGCRSNSGRRTGGPVGGDLMSSEAACGEATTFPRQQARPVDPHSARADGARDAGTAHAAYPFVAPHPTALSNAKPYASFFESALSRLRAEQRYRTFVELERI